MVMDSEQKFIEESRYEIDDWFYSQLEAYDRDHQTLMIAQFLTVINYLPIETKWYQEVAGVIKGTEPLFFAIEFLKESDELTVLIDLNEIEVDEYLDFISNQKSIKSYNDAYRKNGNANQESSGV
jgi:hypothetical protein